MKIFYELLFNILFFLKRPNPSQLFGSIRGFQKDNLPQYATEHIYINGFNENTNPAYLSDCLAYFALKNEVTYR